jgi:hypothetical protein
MKGRTSVFLLAFAVLSLFPAVSLAQRAPENAAQKHPPKARTVAALVSADAKSFMDSKQGQWTVSNPEVLTGYQNQRVKVKYLMSAEPHRAEVLSVKTVPTYTQNTAYKTDSAYHR